MLIIYDFALLLIFENFTLCTLPFTDGKLSFPLYIQRILMIICSYRSKDNLFFTEGLRFSILLYAQLLLLIIYDFCVMLSLFYWQIKAVDLWTAPYRDKLQFSFFSSSFNCNLRFSFQVHSLLLIIYGCIDSFFYTANVLFLLYPLPLLLKIYDYRCSDCLFFSFNLQFLPNTQPLLLIIYSYRCSDSLFFIDNLRFYLYA